MKGVIILTEVRTGSNWLLSMANNTGVLGNADQWIEPSDLGVNADDLTYDQYMEKVFESATSENGFFAIKICPRHIHWFKIFYGYDVIKNLREQHDVSFILLTRRDRLAQAISFSKAAQESSWKSYEPQEKKAQYDFAQICRAYFMIGRSYDFWNSYIDILDLPVTRFVYEDLLDCPHKYVNAVAKHAGISDLPEIKAKPTLKIQRNSQTDEWRKRFLDEIGTRDFLESTVPSKLPARKLSNLIRFLKKKQTKPYPYNPSI